MTNYLFTSESVACGHPDKVCDQICDAILDAHLIQDPSSHVAIEAVVSRGLLFLFGEITSSAVVNFDEIARKTVHEIGYEGSELQFDWRSMGIIQSIQKQSPDISRGIHEEDLDLSVLGAGDQGLMFGFACNETEELMPLPIMLSHRIVRALKTKRESGELPFLRPDGKAQVTVEYNAKNEPIRVKTVVISAQHAADIESREIESELKKLALEMIPKEFLSEEPQFFINPTGRFVIGGPASDSGLTGRKLIVDTYGGMSHHGGGAFSGKDPTKVDRSGAYAARYVAKNIVAAGLATRCEVQIAYAIGVIEPISLKIETFGTGTVSEELICAAVRKFFDLTPGGIIQMLDLRRPIYQKTAFGGHFGRNPEESPWEKTELSEQLKLFLVNKKQTKSTK